MKGCISLAVLVFAFSGCGEEVEHSEVPTRISTSNDQNKEETILSNNDTPIALAKQCCECWEEVKATVNPTRKARKADACSALTMQKLSQLQEIGVSNDWSQKKVETARNEFDAEYSKCE